MKIRAMQQAAALVACLGMLAPPSFGQAPAADATDVALRDGGLFVGKVVNAHGAPIAKTEVSIRQAGEQVVATQTDENGVFAARGLRGGLYQVVSEGGMVSIRLWAPQTAPPAARTAAMIVTGDEILSGQYSAYGPGPGAGHGGHGRGVINWMRNHPLLVGAGIVTAIAVPLAVADDDDNATP